MPTIFNASQTQVLLDGNPIEGVQSIVFRVVSEREDIRAIGTQERIDVNFGLRTVQGELIVTSIDTALEKHLAEKTMFQIVANLNKAQAINPEVKRKLSFDNCFVEAKNFSMDVGGKAVTHYSFTATRVREE